MKRMITSASVPIIRGDNLDILRELGLKQDNLRYNQRVDALVDPGTYKTARNAQVVLMEAAVKAAYDTSLADLTKTGMPSHEAQELAILSAVQTKNVQEKIMDNLFPRGSDAIAMQSSARGKFTGMLDAASEQPKTRAAPRRKAAPRQQIVVVAAPAETAAPAAPKKRRAAKKK